MEEQLDQYREHKEENDIFYKKYWGGKNLQTEDKQKEKDYQIMKDLYNHYHDRDYNMKKIKKIDGLFDATPVLLSERGIINYFDDKDRFENCENNKDWQYMKRIDKSINDIIHLNSDRKHDIELDDIIKRNKSVDIYDGVPTKNIYKQMIVNELGNHELRENVNHFMTTPDEEYDVTRYDTLTQRYDSRTSFKNNNSNLSKNNETIRIRDNYNPNETKHTNINSLNDRESIKRKITISEKNSRNDIANTNTNNNYITKDNTDGNLISQYMTTNARNALINNTSPSEIKMMNTNNNNNDNISLGKSKKKQNWLKTNSKSILQKNGDTITNNFGITKNSVSTLNNDFKVMRQSGFIINSEFVKDTRYDGLNFNPHKELETLFEKANKKEINVDEIMGYFMKKKYKVTYDEKM